MTVREIMNPTPVTITTAHTFGTALQLLMERRIRSLPVVDTCGVYRGMFDLYDVWTVLLPKAALLDYDSLVDLSFVSSAKDRLKELLAEAAPRPVSEFLEKDFIPMVSPDVPAQEAVRLMFHYGGNIAVAERGKLIGLVSAWEILGGLQ